MSEAVHTGTLDSGLLWVVDAAYSVSASPQRKSQAFNGGGFGISVVSGSCYILSCKIWNNCPILHGACIKRGLQFTSLGIVLFGNYFQGKIRLLHYKDLILLNQKNIRDLQRNGATLTLL